MPRGQITLERTPYQKQVWVRALLDSGMTIRAIAKQSGLSQDTVIAIKRLMPSNNTEVEQCKKQVIGSFYGLAKGCQDHITPSKLEESSAYQLMGMASLAVQAARDMEGSNRPIFNMVTIVNDAQNTIAKLDEQLKQLDSVDTGLISSVRKDDAFLHAKVDEHNSPSEK